MPSSRTARAPRRRRRTCPSGRRTRPGSVCRARPRRPGTCAGSRTCRNRRRSARPRAAAGTPRAILASLAGSATSALVSVLPSRKPSTSTPASGWYSITGAPTPAAAARTELRYSFSLSIASSSLPPRGDPGHERPVGRGDLEVPVGQPAGQFGHRARPAARLGTWSKISSSSPPALVVQAPSRSARMAAKSRYPTVKRSRCIPENFPERSGRAGSPGQRVWTVSPRGPYANASNRRRLWLEDPR